MSTTDSILNAFCWMLIHSLWQGILAAAVAGLVIISTPKAGVRLRYGLLVSVMTLFLLACGATFFQQFEQQSTGSAANIPVKVADQLNHAFDQATFQLALGQETAFTQTVIQFLNTNTFWIVLIWACCFIFKSVHLVTGLRHLRQLRNRNIHQPAEWWQEELGRLSRSLGIRQVVRLLESERVNVPVTIGYFKPLILIPFGLLASLSPEQAETVLLHELAHIRRKDYLVNLMQCLVETVFFFNPAILWISALIRNEREACCDDLVMNVAGNRKSYLEVLVLFQEAQLKSVPFAMGLADRRMHLLNRVRRMLSNENQQLTSLEKTVLVLALVGMSAFTFLPESKPVSPKSKPVASTIQPGRKPAPPIVQKPKPAANVVKPHQTTPKKPVVAEPKPVEMATSDTISFEGIRFTSLRYDPSNDGKAEKVNITAIDGTGKKYMISKLNGQVTGLAINDQSVASNELPLYTDLFRRVDQFFEERSESKQRLIEKRMAEGQEKHRRSQEELKRGMAAKQEHLAREKQARFEKDQRHISDKEKRMSFEKDRRHFLENKKHEFRDKEKAHRESAGNLKKKREFDHSSIQPDVDRIHGIMADLVQEGIAGSTEGIEWFGLSDSELIVNGKKQSSDLHRRLQKKYDVKPQYGLYYGPVQMSGTGFFLDRKEPSTSSKK